MPRNTIVCLSSQPWEDGMWTNKQHVMSRLAGEHRVYYVEPGSIPIGRRLSRGVLGVERKTLARRARRSIPITSSWTA